MLTPLGWFYYIYFFDYTIAVVIRISGNELNPCIAGLADQSDHYHFKYHLRRSTFLLFIYSSIVYGAT